MEQGVEDALCFRQDEGAHDVATFTSGPGHRGKNHPSYKHGGASLDFEFEDAKPRIMERDAHKCRLCGDDSRRKLVVHHIVHKPAGGNEESNLITMCRNCHLAVHRMTIVMNRAGDDFVAEMVAIAKRGCR